MDAGILLRMRRPASQTGNALLYSIENLVLERAGIVCATMDANTVTVINSIFRRCQQSGNPPGGLIIIGNGTVRDSDFLNNNGACLGPCGGGAITAEGGKLTIESSYFGNNSVLGEPGLGGAVRATDGIEISDSLF